jgi:flagellin
MATINTNVPSLIAQRNLQKSQSQLNTSLERLSTGLKINSGADDPSGLIASQRLQAEMAGLTQAINNSQQATNVISTADGALNEVSNLLTTIQGLVVGAANTGAMSADEIQANQLQIDSAVASITRIADTTSFAGLNLLNGNLDYITSGVHTSAISALSITQADFGQATNIPVKVNVLTSAQTAALEFRTSSIGAPVTLQIAGNNGITTLSFTSGATATSILEAFNQVSDSTGVTASYIDPSNTASGIAFNSTGYGSSSYVSITAQSGAFQTTDTSGSDKTRATGVDAVATINGALTVGNGRDIKLNTSSLDMELTLGKNFGIGATSFEITGGGAMFQLGAAVTSNQQISLGIGSVAAADLGDSDTGFLSDIVSGGNASLTAGQAEQASNIVTEAIGQIADLRGRLGAFEANTLDTNVNSLNVTLENVTSSESSITDADFAAETSNLTRAQILTQAGTSILATANSTPQDVLSLLQNS